MEEPKIPITYLYSRIPLNITNCSLFDLLLKHFNGLDTLSEDVTKIITSPRTAGIEKVSVLVDYLDCLNYDTEDIEEQDIASEFELLMSVVEAKSMDYSRRLSLPVVAVFFDRPNIIVLGLGPPQRLTRDLFQRRTSKKGNRVRCLDLSLV